MNYKTNYAFSNFFDFVAVPGAGARTTKIGRPRSGKRGLLCNTGLTSITNVFKKLRLVPIWLRGDMETLLYIVAQDGSQIVTRIKFFNTSSQRY